MSWEDKFLPRSQIVRSSLRALDGGITCKHSIDRTSIKGTDDTAGLQGPKSIWIMFLLTIEELASNPALSSKLVEIVDAIPKMLIVFL